MHADKELSLYVDETSTLTVFRGYVDLFVIKKNINDKKISSVNLSFAEATQLCDFLNYCYPKS
jgi:hypothetical protein